NPEEFRRGRHEPPSLQGLQMRAALTSLAAAVSGTAHLSRPCREAGGRDRIEKGCKPHRRAPRGCGPLDNGDGEPLSAQTERRGGAGPAGGLLDGKDPTGRFDFAARCLTSAFTAEPPAATHPTLLSVTQGATLEWLPVS